MDDACPVGRGQPVEDHAGQIERALDGQTASGDDGAQRAAIDVVHDQVVTVPGLADALHARDMRVMKGGGGAGLFQVSAALFGGSKRREDLDGHIAAGLGVAGVIDGSGGALAAGLQDFVPVQAHPGRGTGRGHKRRGQIAIAAIGGEKSLDLVEQHGIAGTGGRKKGAAFVGRAVRCLVKQLFDFLPVLFQRYAPV